MISSLLVLRWMKPSKDKPIKIHTLGKSFVHSLTAISQFFLVNLKGTSLSWLSRVFYYWTAEHYFSSFWIILLNNSYPNLGSRHTHLFADCSRLCWNVLLCAIPTTKNTESNFQKVEKEKWHCNKRQERRMDNSFGHPGKFQPSSAFHLCFGNF